MATAELAPRPGDLARRLDPTIIDTAALRLLDDRLLKVDSGEIDRLWWTMPPQEGKSVRISRAFPLWMLVRNPDRRIVIASYEANTARRWGRAIRNTIRIAPSLGLKLRDDMAAAGEWQIDGHEGGIYTVGIGGALTGRPIDGCLIIDDPVKGRAEADSAAYRDDAYEWLTETAFTRLAPGTPVVGVMTRWHEDDLCGRSMATDPGRWQLVNVPAQCDDPVTDPLGRQHGEYLRSARGRTVEQWEQIKTSVGSRAWNALYQGRPAPTDGGIFKREWWVTAPIRRALARADGTFQAVGVDQVIISVDATFKDSKTSDFVVMQVWGQRGPKAFLLDQVRGRWDFPATCDQLLALCAKWPQATAKIIEDKANGPAIISTLRKRIPGLIPFSPQDSKEARANAVAPFVEAGNVEIPDPSWAPWVGDWLEEMASFPNGAHDDQVDAMTQALHRLFIAGGGLSAFMGQLGR